MLLHTSQGQAVLAETLLRQQEAQDNTDGRVGEGEGGGGERQIGEAVRGQEYRTSSDPEPFELIEEEFGPSGMCTFITTVHVRRILHTLSHTRTHTHTRAHTHTHTQTHTDGTDPYRYQNAPTYNRPRVSESDSDGASSNGQYQVESAAAHKRAN